MKRKHFTILLVAVLVMVFSLEAGAQEADLIINPTAGGYSGISSGGSKMVNINDDIFPFPDSGATHYDWPLETEKEIEWPHGALVKGRAPKIKGRWAVAVTKDEAEFQQALPEYKRLISEGKWLEARQVLHINTHINVSTRVEEFSGGEKIRDLPEEAGRFWFMLSTREYLKYGGYLTFLSFTPDPDYPMVGIGTDIGDKIHGVLQIKTCAGNKGFKNGFAMDIIKARIVDPVE